LIIIGDLMPGVVRGFNESADAIPFLVDRHFWVTCFMYASYLSVFLFLLLISLGSSSFLFLSSAVWTP
jgi:hypothetical protein